MDIRQYAAEHVQCVGNFIADCGDTLEYAGILLRDCLAGGRKILLCGNGGSAADAQHAAAEFVGRMTKEREALAAIALTTDTSALTAIANDYGYTYVFSRQVEALAKPGDVLIGISTSGNSANVFQAMAIAKDLQLHTIGLIGQDRQSKVAECSDFLLSVPSAYTPHVQECHIMALHMLAELVDHPI